MNAWSCVYRTCIRAGVVALCLGGIAVAWGADTMMLYVAPGGNDAWSGRCAEPVEADGPFATIQRARDEVRKLRAAEPDREGGIVVEVAAGTFEFADALELGQEDSGTAACPIEYRAAQGAEVRLVGGKVLKGLRVVTDRATLRLLDPSARGQVYECDLRAQGVTDYGPPAVGGLEVFFKDAPMHISRWPNDGFVRIVDVAGDKPIDVRGTKGDGSGRFIYDGDRPSRWLQEKDPWVHGYWFWDWSEQRHRIGTIDVDKKLIAVEPPLHSYGYRRGQWYYAYNLLCELDEPGEWYLDRETGTLYFWPPEPIEEGSVVVSVTPSLLRMTDASHVTFRGFILEACRGTAVGISGGTQNRIIGCTIRNTGDAAVGISGGTCSGVIGCDIYGTAGGGISLTGGDRPSLTPANLYAENNHIHHYARTQRVYRPGISLNGVGNRASHNLIHNAPHMGMGFGGNDHLIEFNEIHSVCYESNDAGAIYTGRDWSMHGTTIRHNYMHHINGFEGRGCVGVYLDDMFSGTMIYGNLFYKVTRPAFVGGGRDCTIENNVFVECPGSIHIDARAMGWAGDHVPTTMKTRLEAMPYKSDLWRTRYPRLVTTWEDEPAAPKGNQVLRNISVGAKWKDIEGRALPYVYFEGNLFDEDPHFVNPEHLNFQLKDDSPAFALGFKRLPIERMGLFESPLRASWPVSHEVRPMQEPPARETARKGPPPVYRVVKGAPAIDGVLGETEWAFASTAVVLEQGISGEKSKPASKAWLAHDGEALLVAFDNPVDPSNPIREGNAWGQDDAVEFAIQNPSAGKDAPILILRGFPSGFFYSSDEAGAAAKLVEQAAAGVVYKAAKRAGGWSAEWRIPFASLGIDLSKATKYPLNLSVHKSAEPSWQMWIGTGGCTWQVDQAGFIEISK